MHLLIELVFYILLMLLEYKVTVQDVISSNKKTADDWGVEGY